MEEYDDTWAKIKTNGNVGYMMRKFLREIHNDDLGHVTIVLDRNIAMALYATLQSVIVN